MHILSAKLGINGRILAYWCPGCDELHQADADRWAWNGDAERPTLRPSVLHFFTASTGNRVTICHYFIRDGQIAFCSDCPHPFARKTVPLPTLPEHVRSW